MDPALSTRDARELDFGRLYARWEHDAGDGTSLTLVPWLGLERRRRATTFGAVSTSLDADTVCGGLRATWRHRLARGVRVEAGLDGEIRRSELARQGSLGLPAREGDVRVFGQPPSGGVASDRWTVWTLGLAPYVEAGAELGPLRLSPGLRLDPYARSVSRRLPREGGTPEIGLFASDPALEPRLAARLRLHPRLALRAAAGLYHQFPAAEDLSAAFGTPDLPTSRALHLVGGADLELPYDLGLELTGFYVRSSSLAMRDASQSPARARALVASGEGRNFGAQLLVRRTLGKRLSGWLAYTFMRSDRRDRDGEPWRASDYEQQHVLAAVLAAKLPLGLEAGLRLRYTSGFPRTAVTGAVHDATQDRWQPLFGPRNRARLPDFVSLDARLARRFHLGAAELEAFLEVQNVTNAENPDEIVYAPDFSRHDEVRGLPLLTVAGVEWTL